jgi:hypothetical protein
MVYLCLLISFSFQHCSDSFVSFFFFFAFVTVIIFFIFWYKIKIFDLRSILWTSQKHISVNWKELSFPTNCILNPISPPSSSFLVLHVLVLFYSVSSFLFPCLKTNCRTPRYCFLRFKLSYHSVQRGQLWIFLLALFCFLFFCFISLFLYCFSFYCLI